MRNCLALFFVFIFLPGCANHMPQSNLIVRQNDADRSYATGNYELASKLYRQLAKELPTDAGVRYQLGNSLVRQGDIEEAVNSYREALLRDPQHAKAWHNLLQVQLRVAMITAGEMIQTLSPQQPRANQALELGERLLDVFPPAHQVTDEGF